MDGRGRELIAADESAVVSEPPHDAVVVEDSQSDGSLSDPSCADESNRGEIFCETDDVVDQLVAPEADPRRWGRQFSRRGAMGK